MPHGHSRSTGSSAGAGKNAGSNNSVGGGGVLSKVLGSFRRHSHNGDGTANKNEDTAWADTYQITHHPDRPRHDKREGLKSRNSAYVLGQLHRIWRHNQKMVEAKRRERRAGERAVAAEFARSSSQDQRNRDDERGQQGDIRGSSTDPESRLPSLHTGPVHNSSQKAPSPEHQRSSYHHIPANKADQKKGHHGRSTFSPPSPSAASDKMTIRVGLEVENSYGAARSGVFGMNSEGVETGGHRYAEDTSATPLLPPRSFTPSTVPPRPASASISSAPKGSVRKRQTRSLSRSSPQRMPLANAMQTSNTRSQAPRETMTLYINTDQDSTPSLILNSSPVSEQVSPLTPIEDVSDGGDVDRTFLPAGPRESKVCPMPLCGNPLLTTTDRKHNLCTDCRSELQPRQSVFTTDVLNPFSSASSQTSVYAGSGTSLVSEVQYDSTAEVAGAKAQAMPETVRYIDGGSKTRTVNRGSGDRSVDTVRVTEILDSSPKIIINNSDVVSRFNRDRGGFKLQSVPQSRRHARRRRERQLGNSPVERQAVKQTPASPLHDGRRSRNVNNSNNHIGFQLAGWRTAVPSPTPQPSFRRPLDSKQRKASGPLLEPKTFRPPTPSTRHNKDGSIAHRRLSDKCPRAKGGSAASRGVRPSSLSKIHGGKTLVYKGNTPMPSSAPLRSTGHSRNKHRSNPDHIKYRVHEPAGNGASMGEADKKSKLEAEKIIVQDQDIYHEIESIIDCYLRLPDAPETDNEKRKAEAVASYFSGVPLDVEMKIKGFF
ncbi:hypothetical protein F4823DRAFT_61857 [Ustulina deusta]|nr:hypothetical protein F4823DRAFT_61857 [Ustulina deusta]